MAEVWADLLQRQLESASFLCITCALPLREVNELWIVLRRQKKCLRKSLRITTILCGESKWPEGRMHFAGGVVILMRIFWKGSFSQRPECDLRRRHAPGNLEEH